MRAALFWLADRWNILPTTAVLVWSDNKSGSYKKRRYEGSKWVGGRRENDGRVLLRTLLVFAYIVYAVTFRKSS
jgi:hypothetical protein